MSYIKNFKKFLKAEEQTKETGANLAVKEQDAAPNSQASTDDSASEPSTSTSPNVEADPKVIAARSALLQAQTNRDKAIASKQAELDKLKADQNALVNTASGVVNQALQDAAKSTSAT